MRQNSRPEDRLVRGVAIAGGILAVVVAVLVLKPFGPAAIGSDSASSVLYFERITDGRLLERFLGTTPKPLLTLVYGLVHHVSGDWRPVAWLGIAAWVGAVMTTGLLVGRATGAVGAAFVIVGLIASPQLFLDVSIAYGMSWALLFVALAGILVTKERPNWVAAGLALAAGALVRQEVFLLIVAAALIVVGRMLVDWRATGRFWLHPEAGLAVSLVAIPIAMLHDWLLAGDPLYFLAVPVIGAEGRQVPTVGEAGRRVIRVLLEERGLLALAAVGGVLLIVRRAWVLVTGLVVFGPVIALLYVWIAVRGMVTLGRYLTPIDVALIVAAAAAVGVITDALLARLVGGRRGSFGEPASPGVVIAACGLASLLALVISPGVGPVDAELLARIGRDRAVAADWEAMLPSLRAEIAARPPLLEPVPPPDPNSKMVTRPALLVSAGLLSQAGVDLDVGFDRTGRLETLGGTPDELANAEGSLVYVDTRLVATPDFDPAWLLVDERRVVGPVTLAPVGGIDDRVRLLEVEANAPGLRPGSIASVTEPSSLTATVPASHLAP